MRRNRFVLLAAIVGTGVFASFFGGTVAYALFWLTLLTPLLSLGYILYVYARFKVFQQTGRKSLIKGEVTPFEVVLANEDILTYQSLKVSFYQDTAVITCPDLKDAYCLTPGQRARLEATLRCNYRGSYPVGIERIEITDFLYLFRFVYPNRSEINATVLPRVLQLPGLALLPEEEDAKRMDFALASADENLDVETRGYIRGDSPRRIHWKVSARRGQLFTRKTVINPRTDLALIMDNSYTGKRSALSRLIVEDKVVEGSLAVADYCLRKRTACRVLCGDGNEFRVTAKGEFDLFYEFCGRVSFDKKLDAAALLERAAATGANHYIVVTHRLTPALYKTATALLAGSARLAVALSLDEPDEAQQELAAFLRSAGAVMAVMHRDDTVAEKFASESGVGL